MGQTLKGEDRTASKGRTGKSQCAGEKTDTAASTLLLIT